jgi:hypothetical protein
LDVEGVAMMMLRAQERSALLDEKVARYKYGKGDTMLNPYGDLPDPIGLDGNVPLAKVVDQAVARIRAARELEFACGKFDGRYRYSSATGRLERRTDSAEPGGGLEKRAKTVGRHYFSACKNDLSEEQITAARKYFSSYPTLAKVFEDGELAVTFSQGQISGYEF